MAVFGLPPWGIDAALALAWALILAGTLYRYRIGTRTRRATDGWAAVSLVWFAYSLNRLGDYTTGALDVALDAVAIVSLVAATALGVRWWRTRNTDE
ncbi:hypothetical protein [Halocalculus aciditolerans]|uniref:Uncharacterized protein n=1 Tax=Halocalculus aciditolerans TaxID=1383812 RepID=A0A830F8E4_9EURY|nr:hypothetical protein [Halocalculus aciditolerans]GGL49629.1 hypothetical protein GCM10009039_04700 [Halocalculus aciditolerans]